MRDLKECRAEVFRRSEKRIKERKRKRGLALSCCIPVCLVLIVGAVTVLPKLFTPVDESLGVEKSVKIEITDADTALALYESISGFYEASAEEKAEESSTGTDHGEAVGTVGSDKVLLGSSAETQEEDLEQYLDIKAMASIKYTYAASPEQKEQVFTFWIEDGTECEFRLEGNTLVDVKNGTEIELSDEQLEILKEILGLEE